MKKQSVFSVVILLLVSSVTVFGLPRYKVTKLAFVPTAINNKGHVVGERFMWNGKLINLNPNKFFKWSDGLNPHFTMTSINEYDRIVGYGVISGALTSSHPFSWYKGNVTELDGIYGHHGAGPHGINNKGEIVGSAENQNIEDSGNDAMYWKNDKTEAVNLGENYKWRHSTASAINNKGEIAGVWKDADGIEHPFVLSGGKIKDLGSLGTGFKYYDVADINDSGQVVGSTEKTLYSTTGKRAFLWDKKKMVDLGPMQGRPTVATGINNKGQIIGVQDRRGNGDVPFIRIGKTLYDINKLLTKPVVPRITRLVDINDRGEIVGYSDTKGARIGVLLRPVK